LDTDVSPSDEYLSKRSLDASSLLFFALDQGDALAVFSQPSEDIA
jgi:hypothetical protein